MTENHVIHVKQYRGNESEELSCIDKREALRYAGYRSAVTDNEETTALYEDVAEDIGPLCDFRLCYAFYDITWKDGYPILPFAQKSTDLARCLDGCSRVILFAATAGIRIDRYIMREECRSYSRALMAQAIGAERVEALCNTFCMEMKDALGAEGYETTPRYSPGYGDLPLEVQRDFFRILDITKNAGIWLSDSLLMKPSKSVTAIIGLKAK